MDEDCYAKLKLAVSDVDATFTHRKLNLYEAVSVKLRARLFLLEIHERGCVTRGKTLLVELVSSRPSSDMSDIPQLGHRHER
jgi:hypothetical protein